MLCVSLENVLLGLALLFTGFVTAQERNAFVAVGGDVRLNCSRPTSNLTARATWRRMLFSQTGHPDDAILHNSRSNKTTNEKMSVTTVQSGNKQHLDLIITRTNSSDAGSYYCEQIDEKLASHRLVVVETSANCQTNLSASKAAKEGDPIRLTCRFEYSGDLSNLTIEVGLKSSSGNILINNISSNSNQSNVTAHFSLEITPILWNNVRCYTKVSGDRESRTFDGSVCDVRNITLHNDEQGRITLIASMVSLAIFAVCLVVSAVVIVKKRMSSSALLEKPDVVSSSTSNSDSTNPNTLNNSTSYDLRTGSNTIGSTSTSDYLENEARAPRPSHEANPFPTYAEVNKSRVADRKSFIRPMPSVGNVLNRPALIDNVEYAVVNKPKKPSNDMEMGSVGNPARRHDDCNETQASDRGNPKDKKSKKKPPAAARNNPLEMQGDDGTIYSILNVRKPNATTAPMAKPKQKPEGRSRIVIADPNSEYASVDHRMNSIPPPPPSSSRY